MDEVVKTEKGMLRGIDLGANLEEIKKAESAHISEESPDYLFYEFPVDSTNNYTIAYTLENNSLNEIRADIYVTNDTIAKTLCESFISYFSKRYKEPQKENNVLWSWLTLYNNTSVRIELMDESADYHHVGKLSLIIYKEPDMAM